MTNTAHGVVVRQLGCQDPAITAVTMICTFLCVCVWRLGVVDVDVSGSE